MLVIDPFWLALGGGFLFLLGGCVGLFAGWFGREEVEAIQLAKWDGERSS